MLFPSNVPVRRIRFWLRFPSELGLQPPDTGEAKRFWPLYDSYQKELEQLDQKLGKTITEYAEAFNKGPVPNDTAKKLMNEVLNVEEQEVKLKRSYAEKIGKVLPATKAARYVQIENKIRAVVKAELAQVIPLVY